MLEQGGGNAAFNLQIADSVSSFKQLGPVNYNLIARVSKSPLMAERLYFPTRIITNDATGSFQ